ncbi:type II toxin-antitoxin system ParD family antitoxin [Methylobacterium sp. J-077]|uniref:type II toxin-antitoxin system ParD family antitoxin n=1 Tax=Methylobacterium sp. J-077 TaxID=2836656 RepID=UPI001FB9B7C8|nr:type II toxin-antitoxin system ParD family antitoxin [Methylobacterium sp. J-077]MCJ2123264.1 type II toxin-antitoxin system ParD family antitoxin [Methylobacterium sp. J-077]
MVTLNVSLPEAMKDWVEAQAGTGRFGSASAYVRDLIRRDQEKSDGLAQLQTLIAEGFDSGISEQSLDDVLAEARERVRVTRNP